MEMKLDILGHQEILDSYIPLTFAYPTDEGFPHATAIETLKQGLAQLSRDLPWIAGQVVGQGSPKTLKITPFTSQPDLIVKDLRADATVPPFARLQEARFPFSAAVMHEQVLSPRRTVPGLFQNPSEATAQRPVFLAQATWLRGGLLLTFVGHHAVMDATGLGHILALLSTKACLGLPLAPGELHAVMLPRDSAEPMLLLDTVDHAAAERFLPRPPAPPLDARHSPPPPTSSSSSSSPKCTWVYFDFSADALESLKAQASKTPLPKKGQVGGGEGEREGEGRRNEQEQGASHGNMFISTDDALSALVWQSTLRARQPRLKGSDKTTTTTTLARAVNVRSLLGLPAIYPGVVQINTYSTLPVSHLVDQWSLGDLAAELRSELSATDRLVDSARTLATLLHRAIDQGGSKGGHDGEKDDGGGREKHGISMVANLEIDSTDLGMSSWIKLEAYQWDFGLGLGKPVAVRRPTWSPEIEGLVFFLPRALDGHVAVALCMRDEDLARLQTDPVWTQYAQQIG